MGNRTHLRKRERNHRNRGFSPRIYDPFTKLPFHEESFVVVPSVTRLFSHRSNVVPPANYKTRYWTPIDARSAFFTFPFSRAANVSRDSSRLCLDVWNFEFHELVGAREGRGRGGEQRESPLTRRRTRFHGTTDGTSTWNG